MKIIDRDFSSEIRAEIKKHAVMAIIVSILLIALGVMLIISPLISSGVLIWVAFGLMALGGLGLIFQFIFPRGEIRDGTRLVFGIFIVALFVCLLLAAIFYKSNDPEITGFALFTSYILRFFSIFFGVLAIINSIIAFFDIHNEHYGFVIANGILGIILGTLMIVFPFVMTAVSGIISGVYIIVVSIFLLVAAIKFLKHKEN